MSPIESPLVYHRISLPGAPDITHAYIAGPLGAAGAASRFLAQTTPAFILPELYMTYRWIGRRWRLLYEVLSPIDTKVS